jgi:hypothetical protein
MKEFQHLLKVQANRGVPGYSKDKTSSMTSEMNYLNDNVQQIMQPIHNVYMLSSDVEHYNL